MDKADEAATAETNEDGYSEDDPALATFIRYLETKEHKPDYLGGEARLYWTAAMAGPSRFDDANMEWNEAEIVSDFLARLALSLDQRGIVLDSNTLTRLAEDLSFLKTGALLTEPWMNPFKKSAHEVIPLARLIVQQVLDNFGFDALVDAGLSRRHCPTVRETVQRVFHGDRETLGAIMYPLRRLESPLAETMATLINYVLATALVGEAFSDFGLQDIAGRDVLAAAPHSEAVRRLEQGGSIRQADANVRKRISKEIWSPPEPKGLRLVE